MDSKELFKFYESLYFHEAEVRDKITNRLQIPLAILISFLSFYAFMLKDLHINSFSFSFWYTAYSIIFLISIILYIISSTFFVDAFHGSRYLFLPSANESEAYRQELIEYYEGSDNLKESVSKDFDSYLFRKYNMCSSNNTEINDKRSKNIHNCNEFILYNIIPLIFLFLIFNFGSIKHSTTLKEYNVKITNAEPMIFTPHEKNMTEETPKKDIAPPPKEPEPRVIEEDFNLVKKQNTNKDKN